MGSAGTKNTFGLLWGNNFLKKPHENNARSRRENESVFNYAGRDFETLWSSDAENYNQFSGDKKNKQYGGRGGAGWVSHLIATTFVNKLSSCLSTVHHTQHSNRS